MLPDDGKYRGALADQREIAGSEHVRPGVSDYADDRVSGIPDQRQRQVSTGKNDDSTTRSGALISRGRLITSVARRITLLAPVALMTALGAVFIWFGALKLFGYSPVEALIGATLPWADRDLAVALLGVLEVVLGLALLVRRIRKVALAIMIAHLGGTFLTFFAAPQLMVQHGDPLLLTADGEFVFKNLVLIGAALVLLGLDERRRPSTGS
ncbi:DUF417 family protein [Protofrankia symbiont of Coriaria ruscifolia]|uniref:DUF417 family protein n=1 Tax=Protofrankia symbiont of Coriaria ruscifolia TaxID=1306542 RepID=UPI001041455D|nr:DUF417 family protein [Protofrankia symbiont of Coriaria ruscifolia]